MSLPGGDNRRRTSRTIKLVLMGVAGAALLYSCTPGLGGLGALPYLWLFHNPFYRGPMMSAPGSNAPTTATTPGSTTSQRGGFGGSAAESTGTS